MKKGDHLRVNYGVYHHHGIDMGDGNVIHFGRGLSDIANARVEIVTREMFASGRKIKVVITEAGFAADEVIERATSRIDHQNYNLFDNNCEHFVNWCRTGRAESRQISNTESLARLAAAAVSKPMLTRMLHSKVGAQISGRIISRCGSAALAGDASQTAVEMMAIRRGVDQRRARMFGLQAGAATATTAGFACGGPAGSAAGLLIWAAGQVLAGRTVEQTRQMVNETIHRN